MVNERESFEMGNHRIDQRTQTPEVNQEFDKASRSSSGLKRGLQSLIVSVKIVTTHNQYTFFVS